MLSKEVGFIFTPENGQKIADGRKTMTRRPLKPQPMFCDLKNLPHLLKEGMSPFWLWTPKNNIDYSWREGAVPGKIEMSYLPVAVGDTIYVRESYLDDGTGEPGNIHYRGAAADSDLEWIAKEGWKWKPSIHMPKSVCRSRCRITEVRVERLQDITTGDIWREGVDNGKSNPKMGVRYDNMQRMAFESLWNSIYGTTDSKSWAANPWVAVYGWEHKT